MTTEKDTSMVPEQFKTIINEDKLKAITLSTNKDLTNKEVGEKIGKTGNTIGNYISEAEETGLIKLVDDSSRPKIYKPTESLLEILSMINQTKYQLNDKERIAESFDTTFSNKEKRTIGKILEENQEETEWDAIVQRMEQTQRELNSRDRKIISMATNDRSTEHIGNELGISNWRASKLRRELYEEGFLDKKGGERGRGVEWVKGEEFEERLREKEKEDIEPREVETKDSAIREIDQKRALTDYSIDEIFKHYRSEDVLESDQESLFDDIAFDLNSSELQVLSKPYMVDIIQELNEKNSVLEIRDETDYDKSFIEKAISILEKAEIVETEDFKHGLNFKISENYGKILNAIEKTGEILENPDQYRKDQLKSIDMVPTNLDYEISDIEAFELNLYKLKLEEKPREILEEKLRTNNGEMKYSKLSEELGITQDNLLDYVVEARNKGLNLKRRYRDKQHWIYIEEDQEATNIQEASSGDKETNGTMISLDSEEAITDYRQNNNFDLGQEIDPKELPGSKQVHHDGNSEKYRKFWAPKIKPLIQPLTEGDKLSYNEIYKQTEVPHPKGHQTVAWMATRFDSIETYENGIKIN